MVSELRADGAVHWVTASSAPCLSIFKPVILAAGLPDQGSAPSDRYDASTRWWRHEVGHRAALGDYPARIAAFAPVRDATGAWLSASGSITPSRPISGRSICAPRSTPAGARPTPPRMGVVARRRLPGQLGATQRRRAHTP